MGIWDGNTWQWEFNWRRSLYQWELYDLSGLLTLIASKIPTSNSSDHLVWKNGNHTRFSVKSFMEAAHKEVYEEYLNSDVVNFIWQRRSPPRAKLLAYFIAINKLKTCSILLSLGLITPEQALYLYHNSEVETSSYLFFSCQVTWQI